jgi:hypothetical protein
VAEVAELLGQAVGSRELVGEQLAGLRRIAAANAERARTVL